MRSSLSYCVSDYACPDSRLLVEEELSLGAGGEAAGEVVDPVVVGVGQVRDDIAQERRILADWQIYGKHFEKYYTEGIEVFRTRWKLELRWLTLCVFQYVIPQASTDVRRIVGLHTPINTVIERLRFPK